MDKITDQEKKNKNRQILEYATADRTDTSAPDPILYQNSMDNDNCSGTPVNVALNSN